MAASATLGPEITDASEEIFLLYTDLQRSKSSSPDGTHEGLGFVGPNSQTLSIQLTIEPPPLPAQTVATHRKKGKGDKQKSDKAVTVEFELQQNLHDLRNRSGDTGSVLWRVSVHLAKFLLSLHHFPRYGNTLELPPPYPNHVLDENAVVLELGSGSGFLGLALGSTVRKWIYSDQLTSLDLTVLNLVKNGIRDADVRELDWVVESGLYDAAAVEGDTDGDRRRRRRSPYGNSNDATADWPSIIIAADCIYNPHLSIPLARTIARHSKINSTLSIVASELRDSEPFELFLTTWIELGFVVRRLEIDDEGDLSGLGSSCFVVWFGIKVK